MNGVQARGNLASLPSSHSPDIPHQQNAQPLANDQPVPRTPSEVLGMQPPRGSRIPKALQFSAGSILSATGAVAVAYAWQTKDTLSQSQAAGFALVAGGLTTFALTLIENAEKADDIHSLEVGEHGRRIADHLVELLASVPPERQEAAKQFLSRNWESLRPTFGLLHASTGEEARQIAIQLAKNRPLCDALGLPTRQVFTKNDKVNAFALISRLANFKQDEPVEAVLTDGDFLKAGHAFNSLPTVAAHYPGLNLLLPPDERKPTATYDKPHVQLAHDVLSQAGVATAAVKAALAEHDTKPTAS